MTPNFWVLIKMPSVGTQGMCEAFEHCHQKSQVQILAQRVPNWMIWGVIL